MHTTTHSHEALFGGSSLSQNSGLKELLVSCMFLVCNLKRFGTSPGQFPVLFLPYASGKGLQSGSLQGVGQVHFYCIPEVISSLGIPNTLLPSALEAWEAGLALHSKLTFLQLEMRFPAGAPSWCEQQTIAFGSL